jgi:leucyl-tRNA synthetase
MTTYSPAEIEARWQAAWAAADVFKAVRSDDKPKYYVLEMSPIPRGASISGTCATIRWAT